ncbi:MAG: ATP-binding protein, partial [Flavobacteriaceae bacterium]
HKAFEISDYKNLPEEYKKELLAVENHALSFAWQTNSALMIPSHTGKLLPEEHKIILKRFARVFEQAYIRFMDLQKAEAQARESKIEMALERVRSRTMAMHKSEELGEVAAVLFEQISSLTYAPERFNIAIGNKEEKSFDIWVTDQKGHEVSKRFMFQADKSPVVREVFNAWEKEPYIVQDLHGKKLKEWVHYMREEIGLPFDEARLSEHRYINSVFFSHGCIGITTNEPPETETLELIERFAKVFQQTYVRFLDLQKAEAQAREAQIEVALERERSRAMAMHHTDELTDVLGVLFDQFDFLGINPVLTHLTLFDEENETFTLRIARGGKKRVIAEQLIDVNAVESWKTSFANWKKSDLHALDCIDYPPEVLPAVWEVLNEVMTALPEGQKIYPLDFPDGLYTTQGHCKYGYIGFNHSRRATEEEKDIVVRFAKEFGRLYQRFLDIQKAEAQAREAQIAAALEKVRSASLAMHQSKDLHDVLVMLYNQLASLGLKMHSAQIIESIDDFKEMHCWIVTNGVVYPEQVHAPFTKNIFFKRFREAVTNGESFYTLKFSKRQKDNLFQHFFDNTIIRNAPQARKDLVLSSPGLGTSNAMGKYTSLSIMRYDGILYSEEENEIIKRFAKVLEQSYTRFLDIQKAEIQAREAQIEAALERVRSKTMAMHNSEDVGITVVTLFDEVLKLGLDKTIRCGIGILEGSEQMETWSATSYPNGGVDLKVGLLDMTLHPLLVGVKKSWKNGKKGFKYELRGKEVVKYYDALNKAPEYPFHVDLKTLPKVAYHNSFVFSSGILFAFTENPVSDDAAKVLQRFASVFGQTYRRYLDLQKAEEQAREAQIEAALERIRSKAMAMHSSEDLADTVEILYNELDTLQVHALRFGHGKLNSATKTVEVHTATDLGKVVGHLPLEGHPLLEKIYEHYLTKEDLYYTLQGEELKSYYAILSRSIEVPIPPEDAVQHGYFFFLGDTANYAWSDRALDGEELKIYGRLITVLNLTYKRYEELNNAEARAREALIEAALDRVHGQIASMRSTADLERITPLVWNELKTLGIPFIRCGVFIIDEPAETVQVHLSAPDGHSLGAMQMSFTTNTLTANAVAHWRKAQMYKAHWNQQQFLENMQTMIDLGQIKNKKVYQGAERPPESLHLHFLPFTQGMLYVGSSEPLEVEQIDLVQSLADAFAIAYARYDDFAQLEKAKARVETTLSELKTTQNQLVQSEKMASLGELTAGIAHEIQNPLNFVNNFSEVSKELLEEMMEEMEKGDAEEVKAIAQDLIQNLEKINHHGKRADGIVKGMLQHSRSSSGEKEPTDINTLADEYLRLAYHGLRAKDKTFNATLETHFDANIGKVDLMAQDMGRVILNLITNAFYVVKEKKEKHPEGYEPTVTVTTRKERNKVQIAVKDNGNGIPDAIKEKIFQPFFTTKPTGQGTGLGLSMSYDIVTKGHDGHLEVKTKEGKGSEFIITLPINQ